MRANWRGPARLPRDSHKAVEVVMARTAQRDLGPEPPTEEDVVECHVLLPIWQADALIQAAFARHSTAGQIVRRLIDDYLAGNDLAADDRALV
jgi:hypothetical protein